MNTDRTDARDLQDLFTLGDNIVSARDVLVVPWEGGPHDHPLSTEHTFANEVHLGTYDDNEAQLIFNACSIRGHNYIERFDGACLYAFWRKVDTDKVRNINDRRQWDVGREIMSTVQLSRLVQDNTHWIQYAARVIDFDDGRQQIIPFRATHDDHQNRIYRLRPQDRGYLLEDDANKLAPLVERYVNRTTKPPQRISAAMFFIEYSMYEYSIEPFLTTLYMALESLLNTDSHKATAQMVKRLPILAEELGIDGMSKRLANELYEIRSTATHRVHDFPALVDKPPKFAETADKAVILQQIARTTIRRSILDDEFALRFQCECAVDKAFPIPSEEELRAVNCKHGVE